MVTMNKFKKHYRQIKRIKLVGKSFAVFEVEFVIYCWKIKP